MLHSSYFKYGLLEALWCGQNIRRNLLNDIYSCCIILSGL